MAALSSIAGEAIWAPDARNYTKRDVTMVDANGTSEPEVLAADWPAQSETMCKCDTVRKGQPPVRHPTDCMKPHSTTPCSGGPAPRGFMRDGETQAVATNELCRA